MRAGQCILHAASQIIKVNRNRKQTHTPIQMNLPKKACTASHNLKDNILYILYRHRRSGVESPCGIGSKSEKIIHSGGWQENDLCLHVNSDKL